MCDKCGGLGLLLSIRGTATFCGCPAGERRKADWENFGKRVLKKARASRTTPDYKAKATGERWPGEEG